MPSAAESRRLFWAVASVLLVLDFATKRVAEHALLPIPAVEVLGEWLQLRLVYNQGAAFGLHVGPWSRWIFLIVAVVAIVLLYRWPGRALRATGCARSPAGWWPAGRRATWWTASAPPRAWWTSSMSGVGAHRWPTFNVADIGVSCGAVALAISLWLEDARRSRAVNAPSA